MNDETTIGAGPRIPRTPLLPGSVPAASGTGPTTPRPTRDLPVEETADERIRLACTLANCVAALIHLDKAAWDLLSEARGCLPSDMGDETDAVAQARDAAQDAFCATEQACITLARALDDDDPDDLAARALRYLDGVADLPDYAQEAHRSLRALLTAASGDGPGSGPGAV